MQNVIVRGLDNPVVMTFSFTGDFAASGLNTFTSIELVMGGETYTTDGTPDNLSIESDTELRLKIGDTTALAAGNYLPTITGFSITYNDGFMLSGQCKPILGYVKVC